MALVKKRISSRNIKERMPMNINSLPETMTAVQGADTKQAHNVIALKKAKEAPKVTSDAGPGFSNVWTNSPVSPSNCFFSTPSLVLSPGGT